MILWLEEPRYSKFKSLLLFIYGPSTNTSMYFISSFSCICSYVYPVYIQTVLFGYFSLISLRSLVVLCKFWGCNGSPPLSVIPSIYSLSNSAKSSSLAVLSKGIPLLISHVWGFWQPRQRWLQPATHKTTLNYDSSSFPNYF